MLPLNPHIQHLLMVIPFPPRPLQPLDLVVLKPSPHRRLQLPATDLLPGLDLLGRLEPGLEARLHPDPDRGLEREGRRVAADLDTGGL